MVYLKRFSLPKTDVRMITIDNKLFKIGIHLVKHPNKKEESYEEFCSNIKYQEEIEKIMMILLTCKSKLGPIKTDNFTVYPNQRKWKCASSLKFYRHKRLLENCPLQTHFYIEPNMSRKHIETKKYCTAVENVTKHSTYQNQPSSSTSQNTKTQNDARTIAEIKSKSPSNTAGENNDRAQALNTEKKLGNSSKVYDELESGSENDQSVPISNGVQCCDVLCPEDIVSGTFSRNSGNERLSSRNEVACLETAKNDIQPPNKESNEAIKLIFVSETTGQTRKRRGGELDEAPPKKKNCSEYLDTNRHAVQEEELQELLRFQDMATAPDKTPAAMEEQRPANIRHVFRCVKKLVFG